MMTESKPRRHAPPMDHRKTTKGRICRYCGGPITNARRQTFCSDACVDQWICRSSSSGARTVVYARDRGVCAQCGVDCVRLASRLSKMRHRGGFSNRGRWDRRARLRLRIPWHRKSLWDADHIHPVKDGGGLCGPENLQTLCWRCHAAKTFAKKPTGQPALEMTDAP